MSGLIPPSILSYIGEVAVPFIVKEFPPQSTFNEFTVPTIWVDKTAKNAYILTGKPQGVASWVHIGGVPGEIDTITTPDGVVVVPSSNNINFVNGTGSQITGSGSSITFNVRGGGLTWTVVSGTSQQIAINNGYIPNNASLVSFVLPVTSNPGDVVRIAGYGVGGWTITQAAGQQIVYGNVSSTLGVGGSMSSTLAKDCIELVCVVANTIWLGLSAVGNLSVV